MLLSIANLLENKDLIRLGCTCAKLRKIMEDVLYRCPDLDPWDWDRKTYSKSAPSKIVPMKDTLEKRPDLARGVQELELGPRKTTVPIELAVMPALIAQSTPLCGSIEAHICEYFLAGALLHLTPNLRTLKLILHGTEMGKDKPLQKFFGPKVDDRKTDLSVIPGLRHLTTLHFLSNTDHHFQTLWATLPALREVQIRGIYTISDENVSQGPVMVRKLRLDALSPVLSPRDRRHSGWSTFLRHFSVLEELQVQIIPDYRKTNSSEVLGHGLLGSYSTLVNMIGHLRSVLTVLDLRLEHYDPTSFLDFVTPFCPSSLKEFSALKFLRIPYDGLFAKNATPSPSAQDCLARVLPECLERLEVLFPLLDIYNHFDRFLEHPQKTRFALKDVVYHCSNARGHPFEQFMYLSDPHPTFQRLRASNIDVQFHYRKQDRRPGWEEYDKATYALAKWLANGGNAYEGESGTSSFDNWEGC